MLLQVEFTCNSTTYVILVCCLYFWLKWWHIIELCVCLEQSICKTKATKLVIQNNLIWVLCFGWHHLHFWRYWSSSAVLSTQTQLPLIQTSCNLLCNSWRFQHIYDSTQRSKSSLDSCLNWIVLQTVLSDKNVLTISYWTQKLNVS